MTGVQTCALPISGIAIANLDDPAVFDKMVDWMMNTKQGQKFLADARLSNDMSAEEIARLNWSRAKSLFVKRDGTINDELLNKVRVRGEDGGYKISGNLGIEDLPKGDDMPAGIIGPTLVPAVEAEKMTSTIVQKGWTFLGLSNARMSRQPIVLDEVVNIRDRKSTRLNSSHIPLSRMPSSA